MADIELDVDTAYTLAVNKLPLVLKSDGTTISAAVAYNAAGMDLNWNFVTVAGVLSHTNVVPTVTGDYDWTTIDANTNAMYQIEIPASGGASINNNARGHGWFTGQTTAEAVFASPVYGFGTDTGKGIIYGAAATGTLSTTQATSDLTGYADDQLIGRTLTVVGGAAEGEQTQIDDYASLNGLISFTGNPLTTAMGNGDPFKIT